MERARSLCFVHCNLRNVCVCRRTWCEPSRWIGGRSSVGKESISIAVSFVVAPWICESEKLPRGVICVFGFLGDVSGGHRFCSCDTGHKDISITKASRQWTGVSEIIVSCNRPKQWAGSRDPRVELGLCVPSTVV